MKICQWGVVMDEKSELQLKLEKDYMPIIYRNIKKFRLESGMSLIQVADILDMSYDYMRRIEAENDNAKTCSLKLLIKFSNLYNKKIDDFLKE